MASEYKFSSGIRKQAIELSKEFTNGNYCECHHIVPKAIAKKYNLPPELINSLLNCIALEPNLHDWLHGARFCKADRECDWRGLTEEDFIFLAISLLGIDPKYFEQ